MKKETLYLEKREYLQPSIAMYATMEETPLLAGTSLDPNEIKEEDWKDENVDGGEIEL